MMLFMIVNSLIHYDPDVKMKLCFGDWLVMGLNMETVLLRTLPLFQMIALQSFLTHIKENNKYTFL